MKPLVITPGEPAGIGPDILLQMVAHHTFDHPIVVITDRYLLQQRASELKIKITWPDYTPNALAPISVLHIPLNVPCRTGQANPDNSGFVLATIDRAVEGCLQREFAALVTGPVNKSTINAAGFAFSGHTEYLAQKTQSKKVVMLFVYENLRLALLTTHLPLTQVAAQVTAENLVSTIEVVCQGLKKFFHIAQPKFVINGLNPHAGEHGYLGREEIEIIIPTLAKLRQRNFSISGPVAADTVFHWIKQHPVDAIISLYHDQSLPVIKALGFGQVVNVTLGLPIIRTSVDHGTAFELAGSGLADETSLIHATRLAQQFMRNNDDSIAFST